ncbi:5'-phosphate synthase pdxT subunit [Clostridium tetanomorphum]|uniref:Pyridoxal 5'-phosphate synthase subunit PdxT n=1 Tax=Clostridium tetanomorphum TaxID=1553 RepID=A0A923E9M4_CLOTT|nr:pyridoxal 5'-phosphate synthase glutaminase subunit PdxT [Clostridium tetanomorphum]KAJ51973.1 glutamine amidotransferase subunit PdxT [Clostridium tetanomorphum DSM 665]MBC2396974.1 pyridoxal 5'-phosphate synthase glutaminase subunit PdxT [Clostridium tetanomorphum]MBP1862893.1 5'-phosphate synthase pdxT subunit [Clostridium tetanomorphum]NRS87030.1 5'-phosphate synthase pdxT subunit [Clostridium tetanomorphum]NRZ99184.1 5'-phosphate synthase pdxT subunit [Clostridium tetanomorphum]
MRIGVLSLQGGVIEHINHIKSLNHEGVEVKTVKDLENIQGIILPGGESTTMSKLLKERNMLEPLREKILSGLPVWGTCAGMILLAKHIDLFDGHLRVMDITVKRNAYGSQINSFKTEVIINNISPNPIPLVFIRAPFITEVSNNVKILCNLNGNIVATEQQNMLATSFHPELTNNLEFHKYFLAMCMNEFNKK